MRKSRWSKQKQDRLIEHFVAGTTVRCAADLIGVNRKIAVYYFQRLRKIITQAMEEEELFSGEVEVDKSYFGVRRKGKRGRGAAGKILVFGILKLKNRVFTKMIPNAQTKILKLIMWSKIKPDSIVYTDSLASYNVLDVSEFKHERVNHDKNFVQNGTHINGIENFWDQAKRHMRIFNGIPKEHFYLLLKECEWRFNNPKLKD